MRKISKLSKANDKEVMQFSTTIFIDISSYYFSSYNSSDCSPGSLVKANWALERVTCLTRTKFHVLRCKCDPCL